MVRESAAIAHDRELGQALRDLDVQFGRWRNGEISAAELNDVIQQFHDGASREVWRKYAPNRPEAALGFAVATAPMKRHVDMDPRSISAYYDENPYGLVRLSGLVPVHACLVWSGAGVRRPSRRADAAAMTAGV